MSSIPIPTLPDEVLDDKGPGSQHQRLKREGQRRAKGKVELRERTSMKSNNDDWYCPSCDDNAVEDMALCVNLRGR